MVLSRREKYIAIITIVIIMILVADRYVATPFMDKMDQTAIEKQRLIVEMERAETLFERRSLMDRRWNDMVAGGLEGDAAKAESQVLHAIGNWSKENGLMLSSVKPDHKTGEDELYEIVFQVAGTGTMNSVSRFLFQIEKSTLPIRLTDVQLGSREEDGNDLSLQLRLSALYLSGKVDNNSTSSEAGSAAGGSK